MPVIEGAMAVAAADAATKAAATAATTALFKSATERVERTVKGPLKTVAIKALAALKSYSDVLAETNERVSTFKTFADPTKPVSLLDHFVETKFDVGKQKAKINQDDIIDKLRRPARLVISATAGYGKSMVMRYIALALFDNPIGRIPLFMELRNLNRVSNPDIISFLHSSYKRISDVEVESFKRGLAAGAFVLLLDGFDEVNHELRPNIEDQIIKFTRDYPQCSIVVSGRPDDRFKSWKSFSILKVSPMAQSQVVELINKLDYERGVRKRFIAKVKSGLYDSHQSFLSTPLLAILMLLTFEQNANIPDKMYLFYGEAFKTLFHKHDALKEQYDRSRKSGLVVDDFENVFAAFCLKTYVEEKTEFSSKEIKGAILDALNYESITISVDDFLFDIEEAVCLIMKEGASYFFVHRSFQEYFTALFLANCAEAVRDEFIEQVAVRYWDNVLPMLFDMAAPQIEPTWVAANVQKYLDAVGEEPGKLSPLDARFEGLTFWHRNGSAHIHTFKMGRFNRFVGIMSRFYPSIQSGAHIEFEPLERWVSMNWQTIKSKYETASGGIDGAEVITIPPAEFMKEFPNVAGLLDIVNHEHQAILELDRNLDKQQKTKNDFLVKVFGQGARR